jgi:hypothetical protein
MSASDRPVTVNNEPAETRADRVFLRLVLLASLVQGLVGIAKYGYCGQDFGYHDVILQRFPGGFSYGYTNPPGIYALGYLVATVISKRFVYEVTAAILLGCNVWSLWLLYGLVRRIIASRPIRWAAMLLVTFVPFRVVHSIVYSADAVTIPIFLVVARQAVAMFDEGGASIRRWVIIGASTTLGMFFKYTFVGLLPALALIACHQFRTSALGRRRRYVAVAAGVCLLVPLSAFWVQMRLSRGANGATVVSQWLAPGEPPQMNVADVVRLKPADRALLRAPQYFQDGIYEPHRYSYPGLVYLATFTDVLNYFQAAPRLSAHWDTHTRASDGLPRRQNSVAWSPIAVAGSLPVAAAALVGVLSFALASLGWFATRRRGVVVPLMVLAWMACGFYAPILLNITRVRGAYTAGYWLPRLIMPSLLSFLILGFVMVDRAIARLPRGRGICATTCLVYTVMLSFVFIVIT